MAATLKPHIRATSGKKRLLKMTPLRSILGWISCFFFRFFLLFILFFVFFLHVAPPHYWCWLAVSRSNNMAEWFSKNTVAAVRLLGEVTLEEADSLRLCHRWGGLALTPARWPTPPEALAFLLCGDDTHRNNERWCHKSFILTSSFHECFPICWTQFSSQDTAHLTTLRVVNISAVS